LQIGIFGSEPYGNPLRTLGNWIYLSGRNYAMHDSRKEAIKLDDYVTLKIMNYVAANFALVIPKVDSQAYALGVYFGKNIQFLPRDESDPFIPSHIYEYMKTNRFLETGLGEGVGEVFLSLDESYQQEILKRIGTDIEFARGVGKSLGLKFAALDEVHQREVMGKIMTGLPFARWFGESLGRVIPHLPVNTRNDIFRRMKENVQFSDGIGMGLGSVFPADGGNEQ
jgi:hypothetical protein